MNIINKGLVGLVLLPKFIYRRMGADVKDLSLILRTKLLIDDRRPNTIHVTRPQKAGKQISLATVGTMFISALLGVVFLVSFAIGDNLVTQITVYFSLFTILLTLTLITDFTSVLIDVRDNQIILPKPVSDKTFVLARLLHIFIHINKIVLPMSLPGLIFMGLRHGPWPVFTLLFSLFMVTVFSIFLINTIYLVILRITSPQKFKTIISYIQIAMTIVIYGGSQILPRMVDIRHVMAFDIGAKPWRWAVPSYWFAAGWNFFSSFAGTRDNMIGGVLLILVPVVALWIVIKYLAPSFTRKLSVMSAGSESMVLGPKQAQKKSVSFWPIVSKRLADLLTGGPEENMAFQLVWKLTGRLRDFKLKVYPGIGYIAVLIVIMFYKDFSLGSAGPVYSLKTLVLGLTYASGFLFITSVNQLQYADQYKASWFYLTTPIQKPGTLYTGAIKAAAAKLFLPFALIVSTIEIVLFGWQVIPNLLLAISNVILTAFLISIVAFRNLPFSAPQNAGQQTGMMLRYFACTLLGGVLGFLHYLVFSFLPVVCVGIILSVIANWLLINSLKNKSWQTVRTSYEA